MIPRIFLVIISVIASILIIHVGESPAIDPCIGCIDCAGTDNCQFEYHSSNCAFDHGPFVKTEAEVGAADQSFVYPYGLIEFDIDNCSTPKNSLDKTITPQNGPMQGIVTFIFWDDAHNPIDLTGLIYRKYGKTPDKPSPHWYDFMYDGTTGAQIQGNQVTLHFVDGQRGDDDITVNFYIQDQGGPAQLQAVGDSILFPWVVRSADVTTVLSVVNTAETDAEASGLPFHNNKIHIEYWHKKSTANDQEEKCTEYNFEVTSSKDDMVTWDMAGHFNNGLPMFNDTSNEPIAVPDMTLAVEDPRRGFLIVDNATDALNDSGTNVDGTMYGEATIIEHKTGAAWGYIAFNAAYREPLSVAEVNFVNPLDQQGETISEYETTQTILLNPNDATTKLFVTPVGDYPGQGQRRGDYNVRMQLCRFPEKYENGSEPYSGDCTGGGIWNNEEGGFSFTEKKNIACTTADKIIDFFGGAGSSAYTQWVASGKAGWAYVVTHTGNIDNRDGTDAYMETAEAIIGKLEYGTELSWDGSIADTINTFVWLRDMSEQLDYCGDLDWDEDFCRPGGINIIHNEYADGFFPN